MTCSLLSCFASVPARALPECNHAQEIPNAPMPNDDPQMPAISARQAEQHSQSQPVTLQVDAELQSKAEKSTNEAMSLATAGASLWEDPTLPPLQSKFQVPHRELTFHQLIGKGTYKAVYRGRWNNTSVAIVCMRKGGMVPEARVLQRMSNHPNLVQLYRWTTDSMGNEVRLSE